MQSGSPVDHVQLQSRTIDSVAPGEGQVLTYNSIRIILIQLEEGTALRLAFHFPLLHIM